MAAQLTGTKGFGLRGLSSCRVRATTSFPVPLSPVMSTDTLLGATRSMSAKMSCIFLEEPTSEPRTPFSRSLRRGEVRFSPGLALAGSVGEDHFEARGVDRLLDEVIGAELHGLDGAIDGALCGEQDDTLLVGKLAETVQQLDAIHAGHLHVGDHDAGLPGHHFV